MDNLLIIFFYLAVIAIHIGLWKLFTKAGEKGWKAIVPFYNIWIMIQLTGRPKRWIFFIIIPIINIFILLSLYLDFLKSYDQKKFTHQVLGVLFPYFYLPYLGFSSKISYHMKAAEMPKEQKSTFQEWRDAIAFAVIAATIIRWLYMEAFTIPTPSMEKTLLVGDFLFVSKMHYGTRTPKTPLQLPLTHQKIWFTELPSYIDWIQLPQHRLPGFTSVKRNDVVVFNYPEEHQYPTDLKTNYIKRCVAISGDTIQVVNKQVYINRGKAENPPQMQFRYFLKTNQTLNEKLVFKRNNISEYKRNDHREVGFFTGGYMVMTTPETAERLKKVPMIEDVIVAPVQEFKHFIATNDSINEDTFLSNGITSYERVLGGYEIMATPEIARKFTTLPLITAVNMLEFSPENINVRSKNKFDYDMGIYHNTNTYYWSTDFFGPLWVPKKGVTITMNKENVEKYYYTITYFEGYNKEEVEVKKGELFIEGKRIEKYTFKQNYYFMMGDNRHNSLDSRFWGFVPEDHIVGKAFFVWLSWDAQESGFDKIRWQRFLKLIK